VLGLSLTTLKKVCRQLGIFRSSLLPLAPARFCALINKESLHRCGLSPRRWPFVRGATRVQRLGRKAHAHQRHAVTECHVEDADSSSTASLPSASLGPLASPSDSGASLSAFSSGRSTPEPQGVASRCLVGTVGNRAGGSIRRFNIVDTTGNRMRVQVPTSMPLEKILQSFAAKHKVQQSNATFVHREVRVHPSDCPLSLGLLDNDDILCLQVFTSPQLPVQRQNPRAAAQRTSHTPPCSTAPTCITATSARTQLQHATLQQHGAGISLLAVPHRAHIEPPCDDLAWAISLPEVRGACVMRWECGRLWFREFACTREREHLSLSLFSHAHTLSLSLPESMTLSRSLSLSLSLSLTHQMTGSEGNKHDSLWRVTSLSLSLSLSHIHTHTRTHAHTHQ
jgi:hypothetical protein